MPHPETAPLTPLTLPGATVMLQVQRERGVTYVVDGATGIFGQGRDLRAALAGFSLALREHQDALEACTVLTPLLRVQLETIRAYRTAPPGRGRGPQTPDQLTPGQLMRVAADPRFPPARPLLHALERAAAGTALTEAHRDVLAAAGAALRQVAAPRSAPPAAGAACPKCPEGAAGLADLRTAHTKTGHLILASLLDAGYTDTAALASASDERLLTVAGITPSRLHAIRAAVPYEGQTHG